jgi:hypothetical protein
MRSKPGRFSCQKETSILPATPDDDVLPAGACFGCPSTLPEAGLLLHNILANDKLAPKL